IVVLEKLVGVALGIATQIVERVVLREPRQNQYTEVIADGLRRSEGVSILGYGYPSVANVQTIAEPTNIESSGDTDPLTTKVRTDLLFVIFFVDHRVVVAEGHAGIRRHGKPRVARNQGNALETGVQTTLDRRRLGW